MSAEAGGGERRFVDTNLFVYAYDESAGRKREVARTLECRVLYSEDLNAGRSYDGVRVVNPIE